MSPLVAILPLVTYPLAVTAYTWTGGRLGARAVMLLAFPFPILLTHLAVATDRGAAEVARWSAGGLSSVFMVFAWSFVYSRTALVLADRMPVRYQRWEPWLCLGASVVLATAARVVYE